MWRKKWKNKDRRKKGKSAKIILLTKKANPSQLDNPWLVIFHLCYPSPNSMPWSTKSSIACCSSLVLAIVTTTNVLIFISKELLVISLEEVLFSGFGIAMEAGETILFLDLQCLFWYNSLAENMWYLLLAA